MNATVLTAEGAVAVEIDARKSVRQLLNWTLTWILLPNLPFMILWFVGGPPRFTQILYFCAAGLILRKAPRKFQLPVWIGLFTYMCLYFVAALFNLNILSLTHAIRFAGELSPATSPHYVAVTVVILLTLGASFWATRLDQAFTDIRLLLAAVLLTAAFLYADYSMTYEARGTYKHSAPGDTPHESGMMNLDVGGAIAAKRNIVIVMVESLGLPWDSRVRSLVEAPWQIDSVTGRYDVSSGSTAYFGSTTAGEMRELCGRWGEYHDLVETADDGCLPARLRAAGYETTAIHSFDGKFFDRDIWYPNIGFDRSIFGHELHERGAPICGGVFAGVCDRDVPRLLAEELRGKDKPQLLYWLTVNSHLPVPVDAGMKTGDCTWYDAQLSQDYPMICRLMAIYGDISNQLVPVLTDPSLPPTDVLIVGDHMPPFYDRAHRSQFDGTRVPWVLLQHRG